LWIAFPIVPSRHMQSRDPRPPPPSSKVIYIRASTIGSIKERPQVGRPKARLEPKLNQRLRNVRKTLIPMQPGRCRDPQYSPASDSHSRHQWRFLPPLPSKYASLVRDLPNRQLQRLLPDDAQLLGPYILHAS